MVLACLLESLETLKISITKIALNGVVNMELIKSGILNEEMRRRSQISSSSSQLDVLVIDSRGRSQSRKQKPREKSNKYVNVEKDVPNTNGDSTDLELVPPTPVPRQVGDEDQVDQSDEDDALIEVGYEDEEDDVHQLALTLVASPHLMPHIWNALIRRSKGIDTTVERGRSRSNNKFYLAPANDAGFGIYLISISFVISGGLAQ
ncbi:hypothetical protein JRO89_XS09G0201400 [Xanthoceras sorbifolium]|uniref:Uncharacterized protein n=1 Tax=Xanthoceras sorbifolium TaxID=99658 RepID=A0ABQ8HM10_9ROSI|nr:hypothetical protein JRO89_XS09G0201400 [Xanthoceras sorbifolium]